MEVENKKTGDRAEETGNGLSRHGYPAIAGRQPQQQVEPGRVLQMNGIIHSDKSGEVSQVLMKF
jgi:hypothetical protein